MSRLKSFISGKVVWERAKHSHNCKRIESHRINAGDIRLSIPKGRSPVTYCMACGRKMVEADLAKLRSLLSDLEQMLAEDD